MKILKLYLTFEDLAKGSLEIENKLREDGIENKLNNGGLVYNNGVSSIHLKSLSSPVLFSSICGNQFDAIIFPVGIDIGARISSRLFRRPYTQNIEDVLYWAMEGDDYVLGGRIGDWCNGDSL